MATTKKPTPTNPAPKTPKPKKRPMWAWPLPRPANNPPTPRFLDDLVVKHEGRTP